MLRARQASRRSPTTGLLDEVVSLLVHRVCRERVATILDDYCLSNAEAHAHWYTTSTCTTSAFDLALPGRCLHGTLHGSDLDIVDALGPTAKAHRLAWNELHTFLYFSREARPPA